MSDIKCIIIEDEPLAVKILSDYILQTPFLKLQASFKNAILASQWLRENATELIFLDIHLPKLKGMSFLKTLTHPPAVIITTAYHQYAVEGFELNVTDYLLKPFEFERFLNAVTKVKSSQLLNQHHGEGGGVKNFIFLNSERKKIKILFSEIIYIESQREYIKIVTTRKEYISKMSTHEIEDLLPPNLFKRIHRSYIVAINKINSYTADEIDLGEKVLPVGREYKGAIKNL